MYFIKSPFMNVLKKPIDFKMILKDNERMFGENKTWKGFFGMIVFTSVFVLIHWFLANNIDFIRNTSLITYQDYHNPVLVILFGVLLGLGYVLFELPNSFMKRRLKISSGNTVMGLKGFFFIFIDQFDSVLGSGIFMLFFYRPTLPVFIIIIAGGTMAHYLVNVFLFLIKIKHRPG